MKLTGLEVFDATIHKTNMWLKEFMEEMNWTDRRRAYLAFKCVLIAVRDYLPAEQAVHFGDQLPTLIRGFYFEHWNPSNRPMVWRSNEEFLSGLCGYLAQDGESTANAEAILRAVFRMLERKTTEGEIEDLYNILPKGLRDFWPPALRAA